MSARAHIKTIFTFVAMIGVVALLFKFPIIIQVAAAAGIALMFLAGAGYVLYQIYVAIHGEYEAREKAEARQTKIHLAPPTTAVPLARVKETEFEIKPL